MHSGNGALGRFAGLGGTVCGVRRIEPSGDGWRGPRPFRPAAHPAPTPGHRDVRADHATWKAVMKARLDLTPRRQRLAAHLHRCGPRPVLEALLAVERGQSLDLVLEDFARLQPDIYEAV